jgi:acyl-CoA synthetase (NDP forming)
VVDPVTAMLTARSVALVGASARQGSLGARMIDEVGRGPARRIELVNPRYERIGERRCVASLRELEGPVDLALLAVPDNALESQLRDAAECGARSAVVFGSAHGSQLRDALRKIALDAGMALCGAGCMGFVNVEHELRATGYVERETIPGGPIALVTHSGSVFSTMLRTSRALGYTVAISSGQELVTTTADYLEHVLDHTETRIVALVMETIRDGGRFVTALRRAAAMNVPVVVLPVGGTPLGASLVSAHSGALAGERGGWEALAEGTEALLVRDLGELTDTLELLSLAPRARAGGRGIATVHDSGAERALVADVAHDLGIPFAPLGVGTTQQLAAILDDGLQATNPLDLWGTGANTRELFGASLSLMAADPSVSAIALAIDLVEEYDGDTSYIDAALDVDVDIPLVVLSNLASAIDQPAAARLRAAGVPVLEGTGSGLVALRHLLAISNRRELPAQESVDAARHDRWAARLDDERPLDLDESFDLLADYRIPAIGARTVTNAAAAVAASDELGYPVALKTAAPGVTHKTDVHGVVLGVRDADAVRTAYQDLADRLGPEVSVSATARPGVELALGLVRDPQLGPLVVVAAGGVLTELLGDRVVALPPVSRDRAENLLQALRIRSLLDGWRGSAAVRVDAVVDAIIGMSRLAIELGDRFDALDVNPLVVSEAGAVAVDVLVVRRA